MRILVLTTDAFGGHGGIAKYNRDLLTALCAHPSCVEVTAVPRIILNQPDVLPGKLRYVTEGLNSKFKYVVTIVKTVYKYPNYDMVICGHINLLPIAYAISLWKRVPLVLLIYGIDVWKPTKNRFANYLIRKIDWVVSISRITKERLQRWSGLGDDRFYLLPNAFEQERYGLGPKKEELLNRYGLRGKKVLMTFGRLVSQERYKGFDEVLELLPTLLCKIPDLVYMIAGEGNDRIRLEQKAKQLGVKQNVVFTGLVREKEKADYYRLTDVFVMPSRGEGFGFVFLEAMACGIPVVASKVDGSREAVRDGELGILVDPNNPEEIMAGILEALKRPREIPKGLDYFSYQNFEQRLHRIVDQILAQYAKRGKR